MTISSDGDPIIGSVLAGQFRILRLLGEGAMGSVYLADQLSVGRRVVIKLMLPGSERAQHAELEERFQREAHLVARLNHPNLVQLFTFGRAEDGRLFLAMEYVEGCTLRELLLTAGALPEARVLEIMDQVCAALHEAHVLGIVHRDLKPDNVMIAKHREGGDQVKVLDFGIAKLVAAPDKMLSAAGALFGTPQYMAPEQVHARHVDQRTDIYALGLIAYELLTGQPPFESDSAVGVMVQHLSAHALPPSQRRQGLRVTPQTEALIKRCLEKAPEQRFPDMLSLQRQVRLARQTAGLPPVGAESSRAAWASAAPRTLNGTAAPVAGVAPSEHAWRHAPATTLADGHQLQPPAGDSRRDGRVAPLAPAARRRWWQRPYLGGALALLIWALAFGLFSRYRDAARPGIDQTRAALQRPAPVAVMRHTPLFGNTGTSSAELATDAEAQRIAGLQRKHGAIVLRCYNVITASAVQSGAPYAFWTRAAGPTLRGQRPNGIVASLDPAPCGALLAELAEPPLPRLDAALDAYLQAARALHERSEVAWRYYDQKDYLDDELERGRQLHGPLLAAFASFATASAGLRDALDEQAQQIGDWYGAHGSEAERQRLGAEATARSIVRLVNVGWRELSRVDLPELRAQLQRYEGQLDPLGAPAAQLGTLAAAKQLARRASRPQWTPGERSILASVGPQWSVEGTSSAVLFKYNTTPSAFAPIARRYEVPAELDIDAIAEPSREP